MREAEQHVQVGAPAVDFSLPVVHQGRVSTVCRNDYKGRWLAILFYPRDFSFVCPTELTAVSAQIADFERRQCDVLAISIDSIETHRDWLATSSDEGGIAGLQFPLGSDEDGSICRSFGVWRADIGLPNRGTFLVDPDGVIRYILIHDLSVGRNADDLLRVLDAMQAGGLCPANWTTADGVLDIEAMLAPKRVLGHYRIERELGRGTFGVVLAAHDLRLQRKVALKVMHKGTAESEAILLEEAVSAAAISHANICTIHAVERIDGLPTIVMEYLEGRTLDEQIQRAVAPKHFLSIARQLAAGLAAAHDSGVVHGDLKPANVIMRSDTSPVIVDFGLARGRQSDRVDSVMGAVDSPFTGGTDFDTDATVDLRATPSSSSGQLSGTPAYMAPERIGGEVGGPPSDVFSLGMIYIELLTGKNPLRNLSMADWLAQMRQPDLDATLTKGVPSEFRDLVASMLRPSRPTAKEVLGRLTDEPRANNQRASS